MMFTEKLRRHPLVVRSNQPEQQDQIMQSQNDLRQTITNTIIEALKSGGLPPWRQPWSNDPNAPGLHTSLSTGNAYKGINQILLQVAAMRGGFKSKWWATFNQIKQHGASVAKGQKGTQIVLFKRIEKDRIDEAGDEVTDNFYVMRTFVLFNIEQTTGLDKFRVGFTKPLNDAAERYENAEAVIAATEARIEYGGNRAFYSPTKDYIQLPHRHQFESPEAAYETAFHELGHWSEHSSRLNWDRANEGYSMGELIAELSSSLMMGELNLPTTTNLENHAAYLKSWLDGMSGDSKFIFKAAAQANKVVDFLMSFSRTTATTSEPVEIEEPVLV
jgi:antirestriction protein ArdC